MTLTIGDIGALTALGVTITSTFAMVNRYFVRSEIRIAVDALRLELAKERNTVLESRIAPPTEVKGVAPNDR